MNLKAQVDRDIKEAMRRQDKNELNALRAIKSLILIAEKDKVTPLDETTEKTLLMRAVKQRKEAATIFKREKRDILYTKEIAELHVINRYLPEPLSRESLECEIKKIIDRVKASGLQDMGKVMAVATKTLVGRAEGKVISETVKRLLAA